MALRSQDDRADSARSRRGHQRGADITRVVGDLPARIKRSTVTSGLASSTAIDVGELVLDHSV
jgi:hypothetical protein